MKYRKINDATVQCIISKEDMDELGLSISDIFERNEKGEDFLRKIVANAYEEVGYEANSGNIAMQITPMQDSGLVITFSDEGSIGLHNIIEHILNALVSNGTDLSRLADQLSRQQNAQRHEQNRKDAPDVFEAEGLAEERVFAFDSMDDVISFCRTASGEQKIGSCLYRESGVYYLVLMKKRMSWKDFNKLSAQAFDFSHLIKNGENILAYLEEHGECILEQQAVGKLKKYF